MRIIDVDELIGKFTNECIGECGMCPHERSDEDGVCALIANAPTIEAVPVVHGENLQAEWPSLFECSVCHWECGDTVPCDTETFNFCPNCGAKIEGKKV